MNTDETRYVVIIDQKTPAYYHPTLVRYEGAKVHRFEPHDKEWHDLEPGWDPTHENIFEVGLETSSFAEALAFVKKDLARNWLPHGAIFEKWMRVT